MDSKILKALGIDPALIFIFLLILIVILFVLYVNVTMKYNRLKSSYTTFMRGKDGKTLEESMMSGFSDVEAILKYTKQNRTDIQKLNKKMEKSYQKLGIVKYDAFNEMGGKLSFALAMLDNNNTGWIINAMHSREGCYTYVKEIVKGESYVELAEEEAEARTIQMLNVYADFCEDVLAIPVIKGRKTDKEKFAGAEATYTIESLMHDGKALQSGTSHNFGDGFARAFGVQYTDKDNKLQYVHQTSWGMTTRMIGAIIMVHGDDSGLVLPPKVAPTQIMIVPIMQKKEGVLEKAEELRSVLASNFRVKVDDSDKSPGFKFAEQEVKGIPLRVEVGPKDIEAGQAVVVRRDTREKTIVPFDKLSETCEALLAQMHDDMYAKAKAHRDANTHVATNWDEFTDILEKKQGFIKAMWCGEEACETAIKDETGATTRCIPFAQEKLGDVCVHCGKPAKHMVYFGKAY